MLFSNRFNYYQFFPLFGRYSVKKLVHNQISLRRFFGYYSKFCRRKKQITEKKREAIASLFFSLSANLHRQILYIENSLAGLRNGSLCFGRRIFRFFPSLEEFHSYLGEQCVAQYVLFLLHDVFDLFAVFVQLRLQQKLVLWTNVQKIFAVLVLNEFVNLLISHQYSTWVLV